MDAREQIAVLREQLRYHNEKYYNDDAPEISDYESCVRSRRSTPSWRMQIPRRSASAARRADASPR